MFAIQFARGQCGKQVQLPVGSIIWVSWEPFLPEGQPENLKAMHANPDKLSFIDDRHASA
jgi:hypothetical protein